jgi:hypothetical protein
MAEISAIKSVTMKPTEVELIAQIEAFLAKTGMSATAFGITAAGDRRILGDLKERGRELRRETRTKVETFIKTGTPSHTPRTKLKAKRSAPKCKRGDT